MGSGRLKVLEFESLPYHCGRGWQEPISLSSWAQSQTTFLSLPLSWTHPCDDLWPKEYGQNLCISHLALALKNLPRKALLSAICLVTRQETQQGTLGLSGLCHRTEEASFPESASGSHSLPSIFIALMCEYDLTHWDFEVVSRVIPPC